MIASMPTTLVVVALVASVVLPVPRGWLVFSASFAVGLLRGHHLRSLAFQRSEEFFHLLVCARTSEHAPTAVERKALHTARS